MHTGSLEKQKIQLCLICFFVRTLFKENLQYLLAWMSVWNFSRTFIIQTVVSYNCININVYSRVYQNIVILQVNIIWMVVQHQRAILRITGVRAETASVATLSITQSHSQLPDTTCSQVELSAFWQCHFGYLIDIIVCYVQLSRDSTV